MDRYHNFYGAMMPCYLMEGMKEGRKEEEMGSMHRRMVVIYRRAVVSEWFLYGSLVVMDTCPL